MIIRSLFWFKRWQQLSPSEGYKTSILGLTKKISFRNPLWWVKMNECPSPLHGEFQMQNPGCNYSVQRNEYPDPQADAEVIYAHLSSAFFLHSSLADTSQGMKDPPAINHSAINSALHSMNIYLLRIPSEPRFPGFIRTTWVTCFSDSRTVLLSVDTCTPIFLSERLPSPILWDW